MFEKGKGGGVLHGWSLSEERDVRWVLPRSGRGPTVSLHLSVPGLGLGREEVCFVEKVGHKVGGRRGDRTGERVFYGAKESRIVEKNGRCGATFKSVLRRS